MSIVQQECLEENRTKANKYIFIISHCQDNLINFVYSKKLCFKHMSNPFLEILTAISLNLSQNISTPIACLLS